MSIRIQGWRQITFQLHVFTAWGHTWSLGAGWPLKHRKHLDLGRSVPKPLNPWKVCFLKCTLLLSVQFACVKNSSVKNNLMWKKIMYTKITENKCTQNCLNETHIFYTIFTQFTHTHKKEKKKNLNAKIAYYPFTKMFLVSVLFISEVDVIISQCC